MLNQNKAWKHLGSKLYIHTGSVWVQTFRRFTILKGATSFPVLRVPVCLKVWSHQTPSAPSASVPAQECSQYWSPWAFSAQPLPLLKVGRWRRQGIWGCWLVFSFMPLQDTDLVKQGEEGDIGLMGARSWITVRCLENQTQPLEHYYLQGHWATFRVAQEGRKDLEKPGPASEIVAADNMV